MEGLPLGCTPRPPSYQKRYLCGKTVPLWQIYFLQFLKQGNLIPQLVKSIVHMNVYPCIILGLQYLLLSNHFSYKELWIHKAIIFFYSSENFNFQFLMSWIIWYCCMVTHFVDFIHLQIIRYFNCIQNEDILCTNTYFDL